MNSKDLVPVAAVHLPAARIESVIAQRQVIMEAVKKAMQEGVHYGKIPGCGDKPTCHKPGAEVLSLIFGLRPQFEATETRLEGGHIEVLVTCSLFSPDGQIMGQGVGSCSTLESKYRYRSAGRKCPECGKETIIKGRPEYGGGWICFAKKGGCGAKWAAGAVEIEGQETGRVENADIADQYNTVRKMAKKRAHVDAALTTTGASEFFTQDIEDFPDYSAEATTHPEMARPEPKPAPAPVEAEPSAAPDEWILQAPKSIHSGKRILDIYTADPGWIEKVLADERRQKACTRADLANLKAFANVMCAQNKVEEGSHETI